MKKYDVIALGELLIDFTDNGLSPQGNILFEANPGGAPCNVLAMLAQFDHKTAFIGKVGNDMFGIKLKETLEHLSIDTTNLLLDNEVRTTLAFVHTLNDGDRDFSFYRNPGADMMLKDSELDEAMLAATKIFHFGSLSMTHEPARAATKKAIEIAKKNDAIISFDPNLRPPLWRTAEDAREQILYGISQCDLLKISDNELQWLTGEEDYTTGVSILKKIHSIPLILVTMGKDGSRAYYNDLCIEAPAFLQENTIETTGAGDTFYGCALHYVLEYGLNKITQPKLQDMLTFSNAAASIITTRKGALKVMPNIDEIVQCLKKL